MKSLFFLFISNIIAYSAFCQDCNTRAAIKPSVFERTQDNYNTAVSDVKKPAGWDISKMKVNLGKAESWIKNRLTGFTGAKLSYNNEYFLDHVSAGGFTTMFYDATGIKGFCYGKMRFYAYYCYENNDKIFTEGESGSYIKVVFNNVFASELCSDAGVFKINGKLVFKIFEKIRTEGKVDYYELRAKSNVNDTIYTSKQDFILIRNGDKPVFIPITRLEYLEQLLKDIEKYESEQKDFLITNYKRQIKSFEEEIKSYKANDKSYTPEKEAKRRKYFNDDVNEEKLDKDIKKIENNVKASKEVINQYLKKSIEWLNSGFRAFYPYSSYTSKGLIEYFDRLDTFNESKEDLSRTQIVCINPAYYNKSLSVDMPQLIIVQLQKGSYPHMLKVNQLVKQPLVLAPLEAILDPGKNVTPVVAGKQTK